MRKLAVLVYALVLTTAPVAGAASWTVQVTPNPGGAASSELTAVSCGSNTSCIAVGFSTSSAGQERALVERWNGSSWAIQPPAAIPGSSQSSLAGVSCLSDNWCTAVGLSITHTGRQLTLAEHWNGTQWTLQPTVNPSSSLPEHQLSGISCASVNACVAAGDFGRERFNPFYQATFHGLIERWNGHHWTVQLVIHSATGSVHAPVAVSCSSPSTCLTVGSSSTNFPGAPLAWRWNGHHWINIHPPNHGEFAGLMSVSCHSARACMAVGNFFVSRDQNAISEQWNGSYWTVRTPPRPVAAGGAALSGVSCQSASGCTAVGAAGPVDPTGGLAESWNGLHWTIQPTPGGDGWPLLAVSCRASFCAAVGFHDTGTLAERYG